MISLVPEFPHDNPRLSGGTRWICPAVTGAAVAEAAALEPSAVLATALHHLGDAAEEELPLPLPDTTAAERAPASRESGVVLASRIGERTPPASLAELAAAVFAGVATTDDEDDLVVVEELEPLDAFGIEGVEVVDDLVEPPEPLVAEPPHALGSSVEVASPTAAVASPADAFRIYVAALVDVALAVASPEAAAGIVPLMDGATPDAISPEARALLVAAGVLVDTAGGARPSDAFDGARAAWRDILRGTGDDFAACGGAMLDDWSADLLARLSGGAVQTSAIKRELRARGIAAFGMAVAA